MSCSRIDEGCKKTSSSKLSTLKNNCSSGKCDSSSIGRDLGMMLNGSAISKHNRQNYDKESKCTGTNCDQTEKQDSQDFNDYLNKFLEEFKENCSKNDEISECEKGNCKNNYDNDTCASTNDCSTGSASGCSSSGTAQSSGCSGTGSSTGTTSGATSGSATSDEKVQQAMEIVKQNADSDMKAALSKANISFMNRSDNVIGLGSTDGSIQLEKSFVESNTPERVAVLIAHELAHTMGADEDGAENVEKNWCEKFGIKYVKD